MHKKIVAGIVLYNPDLERLKMNIEAIECNEFVHQIVVVDNHSDNVAEAEQLLATHTQIHLIRNTKNVGIARALNQIAQYATEKGATWVLTLDQDSVVPENLIGEYLNYTNLSNVGIIACRIVDMNYGQMHTSRTEGWEYIEQCITSGSLLNLTAWKQVGGFCEELFIDGVDFDFCIRLRQKEYKVLRTNNTYLTHEIGHGRSVKIAGRKALVLNHTARRLYYIARNYLYIGITHGEKVKWSKEVMKRMLLVTLYEKDKLSKLRHMLRGIKHALKGELGEMH